MVFYSSLGFAGSGGCALDIEYEKTEIFDQGCSLFPTKKNNRGNGCNLYEEDLPITTDSRIKRFVYNPNEVYLVVLHYGFQSSIEFKKGEEIETITLGDTYSWKITTLNNRIFIKPQEYNIRTNMTVITNKRSYEFDIIAKDPEEGYQRDLVYVIRFYYPRKGN